MPGVVYQIDLTNPQGGHSFNAYAEIQLKVPTESGLPATHSAYVPPIGPADVPPGSLISLDRMYSAVATTSGTGGLTVFTPPVIPIDAMVLQTTVVDTSPPIAAVAWYEVRVFVDGVMSPASNMSPHQHPHGGRLVAAFRVLPSLAQQAAGIPIKLANPASGDIGTVYVLPVQPASPTSSQSAPYSTFSSAAASGSPGYTQSGWPSTYSSPFVQPCSGCR